MQFFLLIEVELLQCFPFQIAIGHSRCSHFTHKNTLKDMNIRIVIEGTSPKDKDLTKFEIVARKTFRILNFINMKVIPNREFFEQIAFTQFARSRNAQRRKDINIHISVIEIGILRARLDIDGTAM